MKMSKKLATILCACLMGGSLFAGVANVHNTNAYLAKAEQTQAEETAKNEAFKAKVKKHSTYNAGAMDTFLAPIWATDEVVDESATIVTANGSTSLLYLPVPGSVVIRNYHNEKYYVENVDFTVNYQTGEIIRMTSGELPYFEMNEYLLVKEDGVNINIKRDAPALLNDKDVMDSGFNYIAYYGDRQRLDRHFNVSYRVNTALAEKSEAELKAAGYRLDKVKWDAAIDTTNRNQVTNLTGTFPKVAEQTSTYKSFLDKLKMENEATIMFYGDSITFGCNATGFSAGGGYGPLYGPGEGREPFIPRWSDMVSQWLSREYAADITTLNGAVGGWDTWDGVQYWQEAHPSSEMGQKGMTPFDNAGNTDLLVLAFGMNDASSSTVSQTMYKDHIKILISAYYEQRAAKGHKDGAVLLVSSMLPNMQSTWNKWHGEIEGLLNEVANTYNGVVDSYGATRHVAVAPVSSMFKSFEEKDKVTRNVLANNINHPTDFGVRVYAQTILQTLTGYANDSIADGNTIIGNNKVIIGEGASIRLNSQAVDENYDNSYRAGIRFRAYINEEFFSSTGGEQGVKLQERYKAGMWMVPAYYLDAGLTFDETLEQQITAIDGQPQEGTTWVYDVPVSIWDDRKDDKQIEGYMRFNAAMIEIPKLGFLTDLAARAYIYDSVEDVYYVSRGIQVRNVAEVASQALASEMNFTPSQIRLLEWLSTEGIVAGESAGAPTVALPTTFLYNGIAKLLANPNSTYTCTVHGALTATHLVAGKYCIKCLDANQLSTFTAVKWCGACNAVTTGCSHTKNWTFDAYQHSCGGVFTTGQLLNGKYCPTCAQNYVAVENENSGTGANIALTKGDTIKLTKTSVGGIMPLIMVNDNGQYKTLNEVYGQYFSYNSATGQLTVISTPKTGVTTINAVVTIQSKSSLATEIDTVKTQAWTINLYNASLDTKVDNYLFAVVHVGGGATIDIPTFVYDGVTTYAKITYSSNLAITEVDGKWKVTNANGSGLAQGTYTINVSAVGTNPSDHVVETKQIKIRVIDNFVYDHMILESKTDQFKTFIKNYDTIDYITYDVSEQAYRYQTSNATDKVTLAQGNRFTEHFKNNAWEYPYFMMDVKFNTVSNLAFATGNGALYLENGMTDNIRIFVAGDPNAVAISYDEILENTWYTICIPMSQYANSTQYAEYEVFYGANSSVDMYFGNLRFANSVGNSFNDESMRLAKDLAAYKDMEIKWLEDYEGGAWYYGMTTTAGVKINIDDKGNRTFSNDDYGVSLRDVDLETYNTLAPQYNYLAIDMKFDVNGTSSVTAGVTALDHIPTIVFRYGNGVVGFGHNSADYLGAKLFDGYVHRTLQAGTQTAVSAQAGMWLTIIIKNPRSYNGYLFGVLNVNNENVPSHLGVYFRNIRFLNTLEESIVKDAPSVNDFAPDNTRVLSNMNVTRNTEVENQQYYKDQWGAQYSNHVEAGYGKNPNVPKSLSVEDATLVPWTFTPSITTINDVKVTDGKSWFQGDHQRHTVPQTQTTSLTRGAYDNTLVQFAFTNWGYTYSDKIKFNEAIKRSDVESITFRVYAILSPNTTKDANGVETGVASRNPYDTRYGGIRFFGFNTSSISNGTTYNGAMLPANVTQGDWTNVTFSGAELDALQDVDGMIRGFWVGQSAASLANNAGTHDTFINAGYVSLGHAYMNVDSVSVQRKANANNTMRIQMASANNLGSSPMADVYLGEQLKPSVMQGGNKINATTFKAPKISTYADPFENHNLIQYEFYNNNNADGYDKWVTYQTVMFKEPIDSSKVKSISLGGWFSGMQRATPTAGGIYIHPAGADYIHSANGDVTIFKTHTGTDGKQRGYQLPQENLNRYSTVENIPATAIADPDGMIRGFFFTISRDALTSISAVNDGQVGYGYINLDWMEFETTEPASVYDETNGYKFVTESGYNPTMTPSNRERYAIGGTSLSNMRTLLSSHKYVKVDVMFEEKNNLVFAQGVSQFAETYYALKGGFTIGVTPVKQVVIYEQSNARSTAKLPVKYEDMVEGNWYTVIIPIEYPITIGAVDYLFSVMTYAGAEDASCTAWINNLTLADNADVMVIGNDGTDTDMFTRFVSDNETVVTYDKAKQAYKMSADGFIGFTDAAKQLIGKDTMYSRMTMEICLDTYDTTVAPDGSWLYNAIFWNGMETAIGIGEMYADGKLIVDDVVRIYDANGNLVTAESFTAGEWYTVEILNPVIDWAFLGSTGTEIYFRNMVWHVGEISQGYSLVSRGAFNNAWDRL